MINHLDIDDALAEQVKMAAKARGMSVPEFIVAALRQAADAPWSVPGPEKFVQRTHDFGAPLDTHWTKLAELESEEYVRKDSRK